MSMEIADMLMEYELLIAKLYSACAEKFSELQVFWEDLAKEEVGHANTIKDILVQVDGRSVALNQRRFNIRPLEISMEHVKEITDRVTGNDIDLLGALSLALDIEQSTIESKYYEIFTGRSREFNVRMKQVRDESRKHSARIRDMKQKILLSLNS